MKQNDTFFTGFSFCFSVLIRFWGFLTVYITDMYFFYISESFSWENPYNRSKSLNLIRKLVFLVVFLIFCWICEYLGMNSRKIKMLLLMLKCFLEFISWMILKKGIGGERRTVFTLQELNFRSIAKLLKIDSKFIFLYNSTFLFLLFSQSKSNFPMFFALDSLGTYCCFFSQITSLRQNKIHQMNYKIFILL